MFSGSNFMPAIAMLAQSDACNVSPVAPLAAAMTPSEIPPVIIIKAALNGPLASKPLPKLVGSKVSLTVGVNDPK